MIFLDKEEKKKKGLKGCLSEDLSDKVKYNIGHIDSYKKGKRHQKSQKIQKTLYQTR